MDPQHYLVDLVHFFNLIYSGGLSENLTEGLLNTILSECRCPSSIGHSRRADDVKNNLLNLELHFFLLLQTRKFKYQATKKKILSVLYVKNSQTTFFGFFNYLF